MPETAKFMQRNEYYKAKGMATELSAELNTINISIKKILKIDPRQLTGFEAVKKQAEDARGVEKNIATLLSKYKSLRDAYCAKLKLPVRNDLNKTIETFEKVFKEVMNTEESKKGTGVMCQVLAGVTTLSDSSIRRIDDNLKVLQGAFTTAASTLADIETKDPDPLRRPQKVGRTAGCIFSISASKPALDASRDILIKYINELASDLSKQVNQLSEKKDMTSNKKPAGLDRS